MERVVSDNRKAYHDYFVEETYTCGIVLEGAEVKSVRNNNVNLKDSFCYVKNGEIFVRGMHIAVFDKASAFNSRDSRRDRKLLLRRAEINRIFGKIETKGYTLVPLKVLFVGSLVKIQVGLCKGKHTFDKKESIKQKDIERSNLRELRDNN